MDCTDKVNCYKPSGAIGVESASNSAFIPTYPATIGYDFATGIGTINAANLVNNWPSGRSSVGTLKRAVGRLYGPLSVSRRQAALRAADFRT